MFTDESSFSHSEDDVGELTVETTNLVIVASKQELQEIQGVVCGCEFNSARFLAVDHVTDSLLFSARVAEVDECPLTLNTSAEFKFL